MKEEYYMCENCSKDFDNYDECYNHVEQCLDVEDNIKIITRIICKYCNKIYYKEKDAIECEQKHEQENDTYYQELVFNESNLILQKAAEHPQQQRLNEVTKNEKVLDVEN